MAEDKRVSMRKPMLDQSSTKLFRRASSVDDNSQ